MSEDQINNLYISEINNLTSLQDVESSVDFNLEKLNIDFLKSLVLSQFKVMRAQMKKTWTKKTNYTYNHE